MSTQAVGLKQHRFRLQTGEVCLEESPYIICASVRVRAETRRVFQALIVPEFVEAWLRIPDSGALWSVSSMQPCQGFVVECRGETAKTFRIAAAYTALRRRRLLICWKMERNRQLRESSVAMRLVGDFECSILSVCHTGLREFDDFVWHRRLWIESLERLAGLFGAQNLEERAV